jgi:CPA2 family monovalent cation:H+ antiporter-2
MYSNRIVMRLSANDWLLQSVAMTTIAKRAINTEAHVIIAGYGRSGQSLARILEGEHIPYMALDLDPDRVRQAAAAGQSVVFGDAARLQSLMAAGLARASAVVVSYHDTASATKILHLVQAHAPKVPVLVRTIDDADLEKLRAAGATEVVPEALEGSLMLASHALALIGVPMRRVIRVVQDQRDARYGLLRGYFHGADDSTDGAEHLNLRLHSVALSGEAHAIGKSLRTLGLHEFGAEITAIRRSKGRIDISPETVFCGGDIVVLRGATEAIARAEERLLKA